MLIRDEIQALRSNDAPQRHAQAELALTHERWCAGARYQAIEAEMQRYGAGEALDRLPVLADLFTPGSSAARDLLDSLFGVLLAELRARPFGQVPLRHFCNARLASLLIASVGSVGLVVQTIDGAGLRRRDPPRRARPLGLRRGAALRVGAHDDGRLLVQRRRQGDPRQRPRRDRQ